MSRFSRIPAVRGAVALVVLLALLISSIQNVTVHTLSSRAVAQDEPVSSGDVIVILEENVVTASEVQAEAIDDGVEPTAVFTSVVDGYAATVTQEEAEAIAADPNVLGVFPDNPVYQASQTVPAGVKRVGANQNDVANINGIDQRVDADVAVLDSGVDPNTGDINVVGGFDCANAGTFADQSGHGTHVAGTIAALDNNIGVVGVAPGARIWSVRVLNGSGVGSDSTLICGLDWVYANRATIDVVNMSVVGSGEDQPCLRGSGPPDSPLHEVVCEVYDAGIPIVAAAGNDRIDASTVTPATFGEVIAVSAFADYDGMWGGTGIEPPGCSGSTRDDRFFSSGPSTGSNYGPDVDIMAPGVCVLSTSMGGGMSIRTGTSMAVPHVTGAIALYASQNPNASVDSAKGWLHSLAAPQTSPCGIVFGDPDGVPEPVLKVTTADIPPIPPTSSCTSVVPQNAYKLTKSGASGGASNYVRDNKLNTIWATKNITPPNAFVWVQLAQSSPIGSIRWIMGETGFADRYWIETSDDMVTWKRIAKRGNKPVGVWNEFVLSNVSAKFVRFRFDNPYGDARIGGIAEIQIWAPDAPPLGPPPVKYPITSTKQTLNSKNGIKVLDGIAGTFWITNTSSTIPQNAILQLSLDSTKHVGVVRWMFGQEGKADVVKIEISTNGINWTLAATRTNAPLYQWQQFAINQSAKYVRFKVENPNADPTIGAIAEVEIWSAPGGPLTTVTTPTAQADVATATSTATPSTTAAPSATATPTEQVGEQGTPTETPTATATPTEAPTQTPTPTEIATETATQTPEPTATETESPTATATPVPTETPTEVPIEPDIDDVESPTESAVEDDPGPYRPARIRGSANARGVEFLVDGDASTYWLSESAQTPRSAWVLFDLGEPRAIGVIRWLFAAPGLADSYTLEISDDRRNWTTLYEGGFPEAGVWFEVYPGPEARYIRITVENPNRLPQIGGLAEVEIWP